MRDKMMAEVLEEYEAFKAEEANTPSYKKPKGPYCPRCVSPLKKRKPANGEAFFECKRHGFVRHVLS